MLPFDDTFFMNKALDEAQKAYEEGEVPVGAVIVSNNRIIARAHNQTELLHDVTAHCEILAITSAANHLSNKYLQDCTLYVTLEPCVMCAGALKWSKIGRIVYAASDEKHGFMKYGKELLHPATTLEFGLLQDSSKEILQSFFRKKRKK